MRKMYSKNQIKAIIQEAINSGAIESPVMIQGNFTDSNDDEFSIISVLNPYKNEGKYSCFCVGVGSYFSISIDFENQEVLDSDGEEIQLNSAYIQLLKTLNGEVVEEINF